MPDSAAEIAFEQVMRGLDGQADDLSNVRSHLNLIITGAGVAAAFLGAQGHHHRWVVAAAAVAFVGIALVTIAVYWPVDWVHDFGGYKLINEYVDTEPPWEPVAMMRELAIHAADGHRSNRVILDRLFNLQSLALVLFGLEVLALLVNLGWS